MSIKISELIKLIEACGKSGVKKFVHETEDGLPLHLEFHEQPKLHIEPQHIAPAVEKTSQKFHVEHGGAIEVPLAPSGPVLSDQISPDFERQEALRLLEEDFDQLQIEDPEKYEELLAYEKLGDFGESHAN